MLKTSIVFRATGRGFSPTSVEGRTRIVFSKKNEQGDLGRLGRYRGLPTPYGSAELASEAEADLLSPNNDFFRAVEVLAPACEAAGATEMHLHLDVAFREQCNLEIGPAFISAVARLGMTLTMSCYQDATS